MKHLLAMSAMLFALGVVGCGSDGPSTGDGTEEHAIQPVSEQTQQPSGPEGTLAPTSFGSVERGMEIDEVTALWGDPISGADIRAAK